MGHRHVMSYQRNIIGTSIYHNMSVSQSCLLSFYAIHIFLFKFPKFLFTCLLSFFFWTLVLLVRYNNACLRLFVVILQDLHCLHRSYHNVDHWCITLY